MNQEAPEIPIVLQMQPILLKPADAARVLAIGERTLWELTQKGEIQAVNVGQGKERRSVRYLVKDLTAWAEAHRDEKTADAAGASE